MDVMGKGLTNGAGQGESELRTIPRVLGKEGPERACELEVNG